MTLFAHSHYRNLAYGVLYSVAVILGATVAYVLCGWSWSDALYFTIISIFTVGYGELHPITGILRGITMAIIVLGWAGLTFLAAALVQFITFAQIQQLVGGRRMKSQLDQMTNHVIICGYGRIGQMLADELTAGGAAFVVVELDEARFQDAVSRGRLAVRGDATNEGVLESVGVQRARALATVVPNDAANVFITLSARNLNKDLEIIARGEAPSTKSKLLQAGANSVVEPAHIGAERMAQLILFPRTSRFSEGSERMRMLGVGLRTLGLELEVMPVAADSPLAGTTIEAVERDHSLFVIAVNLRDGETLSRPDPATVIHPGDGVVVITRATRATPHIS